MNTDPGISGVLIGINEFAGLPVETNDGRRRQTNEEVIFPTCQTANEQRTGDCFPAYAYSVEQFARHIPPLGLPMKLPNPGIVEQVDSRYLASGFNVVKANVTSIGIVYRQYLVAQK